jgi:hypothetical protein
MRRLPTPSRRLPRLAPPRRAAPRPPGAAPRAARLPLALAVPGRVRARLPRSVLPRAGRRPLAPRRAPARRGLARPPGAHARPPRGRPAPPAGLHGRLPLVVARSGALLAVVLAARRRAAPRAASAVGFTLRPRSPWLPLRRLGRVRASSLPVPRMARRSACVRTGVVPMSRAAAPQRLDSRLQCRGPRVADFRRAVALEHLASACCSWFRVRLPHDTVRPVLRRVELSPRQRFTRRRNTSPRSAARRP